MVQVRARSVAGSHTNIYMTAAERRCYQSLFRSFSRYADTSLLDYLRGRNVSPYFLHEIDMFLAAHPEIAHYKPRFTSNINHLPMVDAYRFFMKGYTKPARYANGVSCRLAAAEMLREALPEQRGI